MVRVYSVPPNELSPSKGASRASEPVGEVELNLWRKEKQVRFLRML